MTCHYIPLYVKRNSLSSTETEVVYIYMNILTAAKNELKSILSYLNAHVLMGFHEARYTNLVVMRITFQ